MISSLHRMAGYDLRLVSVDKFKTASVQFRFAAPFRPETLNLRALLPYVLLAGTAAHPTKRRIADACDRLYGARLTASVHKAGAMSVVVLGVSVVDERFLIAEEPVLDRALDLLRELVFQPRLIADAFRKGAVRDEIRLLREDIEADYADRAEWSFQRLCERMFADEFARYRPKGDYDTLPSVTPEALAGAWRSMLADDFVECSAVGDLAPETIVPKILSRFAFTTPRPVVPDWIDRESKEIASVQEVVETADVSQARVLVGWRLPIWPGSPAYHAVLVANALFGDADTSLLFSVVRERARLCYYVYSILSPAKGVLFAAAGVDPGRERETADLIRTVLARIAAGEFTEEDLQLAKTAVIKRIRQASDSVRGIMNDFSHFDRHYGRAYEATDNIARVEAVAAADVAAVMGKAVCDTVYWLTREVE
jgi:predicted Zn-dependent peptidase